MTTPLTSDNYHFSNLLKTGSRDAFSELYDKYSPALFGVICRIVQNKVTGEELLQDVFVKIWKNIDNYSEEKGSLFTWVLSITRHTAIDYLRSKQHKYRSQIQNADINEYIKKHTSIPVETMSSGYRNIIAKLEPKYRQVLDMVYFFGYTQEEVSRILELPLGTIKTRARTGLQILRKLL